jgi:hypothetical protein
MKCVVGKIGIDSAQFPLSLDACLPVGRGEGWGEGALLPFLSPSPPTREAVKDLVGAVSGHSGPDFHRDKLQPGDRREAE